MGLCDRRRRILTAVVDDYVRTAEPVGSEMLARMHDFGVRSATIRNELAAMSEMGYLRQPHTSAGRVPSDLGYRYYVDELMPEPVLDDAETHRAQAWKYYESEIDDILRHTCRLLSELTRYTSMATMPQVDTVNIKHVALSAVGRGKVLVVTVLNTGHIDNHVLETSLAPTAPELLALGNLINEWFQGSDRGLLALRSSRDLPPRMAPLKPLYEAVASVLGQVLSSAAADDVCVEGTSHILKQPEFSRTEKVARIMDALDRRRSVFQLLSSTLLGPDVTVVIGAENLMSEMSECSFVASRYSVEGRVCGSIGVLGPTRMDYRRAVGAVRFMASNLSGLLTILSIG